MERGDSIRESEQSKGTGQAVIGQFLRAQFLEHDTPIAADTARLLVSSADRFRGVGRDCFHREADLWGVEEIVPRDSNLLEGLS
jgi:hypothetical protein